MKNWPRAQPVQPTTIEELQHLLEVFTDTYNQHRPHRSLPHRATPTAIYTSRPKAAPITGARETDTHHRVRRDRIDTTGNVTTGSGTLRLNGRLHHIGIGRTHARTHVILLVHDLDARIIHAATGELLRELTINSRPDYQPTSRPPRPSRHQKQDS